ncbi:MAG: hypothetical protein PWP71_207 [Clostridia bacterium]|jgi:murein DD-endopeptidase MepM/ murein hydrolase activator NlpD|nr:hypothetical protein [Clostridia bacterium]
MNKEKLSQILAQYSDYLKKYGIYILVILFISSLSLTFMLNKIKENNKIEDNVSQSKAGVEIGVMEDKEVPTPPATKNQNEKHNETQTQTQTPLNPENNKDKNLNDQDEKEQKTTENQPVSPKKISQTEKPVTSYQPLSTKLEWPVQGEIINGYGLRYSKTFADYRLHPGIDIKTKPGIDVKAALGGKVILVESSKKQRITIEIDHGNGWLTRYAHLAQSVVKKGQTIKAGQKIGQAGAPGVEEIEDGSHVHLELKQNEQWVDPLAYLKK